MRTLVEVVSRGLPGVSLDFLVEGTEHGVEDDLDSGAIEQRLMMAATALIERDPAYGTLAARLLLRSLGRAVSGEPEGAGVTERAQRAAFASGIRHGVAAGIFDERLLGFDLARLSRALEPARDELLEYMGLRILADRYLARKADRIIELPQALWMRIAMGLALGEADRDARAIEFYDLMSSLRYVPSTPTLFHAGLRRPQLSSCYVTTVSDDLAHIFKSLSDNAQLSKWSGGLGNDWTSIRATGAPIHTTRVQSQGLIPFLKIANDVAMVINRSGKRRGATCAYVELWHYDIESFLELHRNTGDERRRTPDMSTAVWVPDLFMKRLEAGGTWTLFSPDEVPELHDLYSAAFEQRYEEREAEAAEGRLSLCRRVPAEQLWRRLLTMLFETGHPWITFKDPCNVRSPQDHAGVVHSSNLCTEITLNTSEAETAVCTIGSVNLARHLDGGRLDEDRLAATVATAIRMLDNAIDVNFYPTEEARRSNERHRPVGLGLMGFQDVLFELDVAFTSEEAVAFADRVMELISFHAIRSSAELARERGPYPTYEGSKWDRGLLPHDTLELLERERGVAVDVPRDQRLDWTPVRALVQAHGMRNSNTMAIAPTATIANIAGCVPCIEPIFSNLYVKSNLSGEFTVVNRHLVRDLQALGLWSRELLDHIKYLDGSVQGIPEIPLPLREKYRQAFEIDPLHAVRMTAVRGKWIDQSQAHTVFMRGASGRQLDRIYRAAWRMGLKTTYYLRTLAVSQIEKATLDAATYGFTQMRPAVEEPAAALCRIDDPECEACQ